MDWRDLQLTLIAFFSETIGTLSGFGSSTFFVPLAVFLESFQLVLALTAMLHVFGNLSKLFLFRKSSDLVLAMRLALPSVLLTGLGALLSSYLSSSDFTLILGVVLMLMAGALFFSVPKVPALPAGAATIVTAASGFLTGLVGTGGALRGLALISLRLEKNQFVFTSSAIDIGGDFLRLGIYLSEGYMDWSLWRYLIWLGLAAISGAWVGRHLLAKIPQTSFDRLVAGLVFLSGLALVFGKHQ